MPSVAIVGIRTEVTMNSEKSCVVFGKTFFPKNSHQQCCSSECANIKSHETTKKYYVCQHCGKLFWRPNAFRMKYCSPECRYAARTLARPKEETPASTVYKRVCAWCGDEFETTFPNKIYCGSECSYNGNLKKEARTVGRCLCASYPYLQRMWE